jgi:small-conductance mechanosensitive channel
MFQFPESSRRSRAHQLARWFTVSMVWLVLALLLQVGAQASADGSAAADSAVSKSALPSEVSESIVSAVERMRLLVADIKQLESRLEGSEGMARQVIQTRLQRDWNGLIETGHDAARQVLVHAEGGYDTSAYREQLVKFLATVPTAIYAVIDRMNRSVTIPGNEASATEQAAVDAEAQVAIGHVLVLYDRLLENIELARQFDVDIDADVAALNARLEERAASTSAFLDQGLDTSLYEAQLIATTGEITTDIFDFDVLTGLLSSWFGSLGTWVVENGGSMFFSLLIFVVIVLAFYKLAKTAQRLLDKAMESAHIQVSQLLHRMILSTTRSVILVVGILIALSQLGISLGPLLAGLGIAGFVIGFALQDSLSNFASGIMILIYKPFDVGDLVEVAGAFGTVSHMSLVNTTVLTIDNQALVVPNNSIWQNVIKNVTAQDTRRIDMIFGIGYSDDIPKAEKILQEIIETHDLVLEDPEPIVRLHELGDSSVNFVVRPWVKTDDYWNVYWDITREVKLAFDAQGVSIPFPQRDVHIFNESPQVETTHKGEGRRAVSEKGAAAQHRREFDSATASIHEDN